MKLSSADAWCRYIPAPGTTTSGSSPFGKCLTELGVELPSGLSLESMVARGWVRPRLRVPLPRAAFDAWTNFPISSPVEADGCPEEHVWALNLYLNTVSVRRPRRTERWWIYELDDQHSILAQSARSHALDPADPAAQLPSSFRHARHNQEIRPWIDYFAYWQAFQIADYAEAMVDPDVLTNDLPSDPERANAARAERVRRIHNQRSRAWSGRYPAFEWLSRMRTAFAASAASGRSYHDLDGALKSIAVEANVTLDGMKHDVRNVLLPMWEELAGPPRRATRAPKQLLHLLRQEIEYGLFYIERIGGLKVDLLDEYWSPPTRNANEPSLIRALPREEDLARREFPWHAEPYLEKARASLPALAHLDRQGVKDLVDAHWRRSRSLRRLALALHRLHEQLHGERLSAEDEVIRQTERIEQFNLIIMHTERFLSNELRERRGDKRYPDVRDLARESLNHLLGTWGLLAGGFSAVAQSRVTALFRERAQLHELDEEIGLRLVNAGDVVSGSAVADELIAAFVNLVIARNYAAHHDALDFELVYPSRRRGRPHGGSLALQSVLVAVLGTLAAR